MKSFLVSCLLFLSLSVRSQITPATVELLTRSMELLEKGEYAKVIPIAEKTIEAIKKELGENDPLYNGQFFILGYCHYKLYHYQKAEENYLRQKELLEKLTGDNNLTYSACLGRLAVLYRDMAKYQQSIALFLRVKAINKTILGEDSPDYSTALNNLASLYQSIGQYPQAEQLFIESGTIFRRTSGENTALYAASLNNLASLYSDMGQYEKAKTLCEQGLETRKNVLGATHPDYAESLNNLASLHVDMGNYGEAESLYTRANAIFKKALGETSPYYAVGLNNLGDFYQTTGQYAKAEKLFIEAREIRKKVLGEQHPDYATSLSNLAGLYVSAGQFEKAEALYIRAREIKKIAYGETHPDYSVSLNNLGLLYESMGQYKKAESLYLESAAIKKKALGSTHLSYAIALNNLGTLYKALGQYEKSEPLFTEALEITKASLGENNIAFATSLDNLANIWQSLGKFSEAEPAYLRAMQIRKNVLGENNTYYAYSLNNLAALYGEMDQYQKAEALMVQAKDIWKRTAGENSPAYANGADNLATIYRKTGTAPGKAEALYLEALRLRKTILGETHPDYADTQNGLALLYAQTGLYQKAEPFFLASSAVLLQNIAGLFPILSEKEKGKYLDYNREIIEWNNSFLYTCPKASVAIIENNYNLELGFKSLSLADTRHLLEQLRNSRDTVIKKLFDQWVMVKKVLAKQYALSAKGRMNELKSIEAEAEALEKELNRRSSAFSSQQKALRVTVREVQQNLAAEEAAIEFVKFRVYHNKWTDSVIYGAYILNKTRAAPHFVVLCEEKQLQALFDKAGQTASRLVHSFYRGLEVQSKEAKLGIELYKLVWEPLEPFLKGIKKIAYSPAGKLYGVAFHALPVDSSSLLMDRYRLQQYTSTRQLSLRNARDQEGKPGSIVLFGDAQFSMDSLALVRQRKKSVDAEINSASSYIPASRGNETGVWVNLPGTAEEIKKIGQLFTEHRVSQRSYTRESASEDNLKLLSGKSSPILHIATHGFFLPESNQKKAAGSGRDNVYSLAEDPLLRTGLVLAGGNYAWSGKTPVDGVEDGIATAYEIAQLNLGNTELLVLSACETALGEIKGSEGVFGLQRGFKMAGVRKMLVSLWQVPDKETAELMTGFYTYWMKGKRISESFYQAQADLRKKYPAYYWAAFVLVE